MTSSLTYQIINDDYKKIINQNVKADLILVDPPYNINIAEMDWDNNFNYEELFRVLQTILSINGTILLFNPPQNLITISKLIEEFDFELQDLLLWQKPNIIPNYMRSKGYTTKGREYIFYLTNKGKKPYFVLSSFEKYHDGIYKYPRVTSDKRTHVCQKPKYLIEDLIRRHSKPNDLVVDLFLGSGVSASVASKLRRNFIGYEKDTKTYNELRNRVK